VSNIYKSLFEKHIGKRQLRGPRSRWRIILKWIIKKLHVRMSTEFIWVMTVSSVGLL